MGQLLTAAIQLQQNELPDEAAEIGRTGTYLFAAPTLAFVVEGKESVVLSAADSIVSDPGIVVNIV